MLALRAAQKVLHAESQHLVRVRVHQPVLFHVVAAGPGIEPGCLNEVQGFRPGIH